MMGFILVPMPTSATAVVSMPGWDGVYAGADAVIVNSGSIDAEYDGIDAWNNAVITNSGSIDAGGRWD